MDSTIGVRRMYSASFWHRRQSNALGKILAVPTIEYPRPVFGTADNRVHSASFWHCCQSKTGVLVIASEVSCCPHDRIGNE